MKPGTSSVLFAGFLQPSPALATEKVLKIYLIQKDKNGRRNEWGQSQTEVASSCWYSVLEITARTDSQKDCHRAASITPADDIIHSFNKSLFCSVQLLSHVWLFVTSWTAARQASLSITNSQSLLKLMSVESVMPYILSSSSFLLLPSIFPTLRVFSNESALHIRWPKYWRFSFSIRLSSEYSGVISFRTDWFDLLQLKGLSKVFSNSTVQKH